MRTIFLLLLMPSWGLAAENLPRDLIAALATGPQGTSDRQPSLAVPQYVLKSAENEISCSEATRHATEKLAPSRAPKDWVAALQKWDSAVEMLEHERAVWCLQVCLCHPDQPVTTRAVEALARLKDTKAVPFLVTFAEYEDANVPVEGSRNIVIYESLADAIAETLATLTGVPRSGDKDSFRPLLPDLPRWQKWAAEHPQPQA